MTLYTKLENAARLLMLRSGIQVQVQSVAKTMLGDDLLFTSSSTLLVSRVT